MSEATMNPNPLTPTPTLTLNVQDSMQYLPDRSAKATILRHDIFLKPYWSKPDAWCQGSYQKTSRLGQGLITRHNPNLNHDNLYTTNLRIWTSLYAWPTQAQLETTRARLFPNLKIPELPELPARLPNDEEVAAYASSLYRAGVETIETVTRDSPPPSKKGVHEYAHGFKMGRPSHSAVEDVMLEVL